MIKTGMFISDRYEIMDKVGSGGMADVYKAKCHRLNRYVAIKILKPEYSNDKNFVAKFRAEAQSAAGLSHPNIVNVYDVGDDDGLYYIVMELVEGITLKRFIERKEKLEVKEAVGIAIQIAQGMEAAHQNHIIHRDIKPQNIIISRDGKVKVTDFGIAKAATSNTVTQNAIGSVHYLSPEQARGGYSDEKSDIYSLGVTLYEMLTGKVPFVGDNTVSVALLHIQSEAVPVRELNPIVPISVEKIVQKCMQKKPERRYLSASELIADLKRSIQQPDGDFVVMSGSVVDDSPTIHITDDEMNTIKSAAKTPVTYYDKTQENTSKKVEREIEEELDSYSSKTEKFLMIGTISIAVILGIAILYLVANFFGLFDFMKDNSENQNPINSPTPSITGQVTPENTPTPEEQNGDNEVKEMITVVGLPIEQARESLMAVSEHFQIDYSTEEYSKEFKKGYVIRQDPVAETHIVQNAKITLVLSAGPEPKTIPPTHGNTAEKAATILSNMFDVGFSYETSDEFEENMVIRTEPDAGETLLEGEKIIIVVSLGPDKTLTTVPKLLGKTKEEAVLALEEVGLKLGTPSYASSETYPEDQICYQSTTAGQKVAVGVTIDISISTGPESTPSPTPSPTPTEEPTPTPTKDPTPIPTPTQDPNEQTGPVYSGSVQITKNPLSEGESGVIVLELVQEDGRGGEITKTVLERTMSYEDLTTMPTFYFTGEYAGIGTVHLYVDNDLKDSYAVELREQ